MRILAFYESDVDLVMDCLFVLKRGIDIAL